MKTEIKEILEHVKDGSMSVDDALLKIKTAPYEDIGYARVDLHRQARQGVCEVIYGAGKTPDRIAGIVKTMQDNGQNRIMVTRLSREKYEELACTYVNKYGSRNLTRECAQSDDGDMSEDHKELDDMFTYYEDARIALTGGMPEPDGIGKIVVATGGTSDIPVAEEAAITAQALKNDVVRLYDVGVAGLHRLLDQTEEIMSASVIIAIAGMEGALASVIGGLADCPVIAVPTSVGYGASFNGLSALLSMLNSCASGVSVVNIDNGFGAGYLASMINHMG